MIGKIAARAVELAADDNWLPDMLQPWRADALYFSAAPRERLKAMAALPDSPFGQISERSRNNLGIPSSEITHWLDVSRWVDLKKQVLGSHHTQVDPEAFLNPDSPMAQRLLHAFEQYQRRPLPWDVDMETEDALERARSEIGAKEVPGIT
jgi:LmbE family N-acetylglucosaminyl deacetylase